MATGESGNHGKGPPIRPPTPAITFRDVCFSYGGPPVLEDVNLSIGRTGGGVHRRAQRRRKDHAGEADPRPVDARSGARSACSASRPAGRGFGSATCRNTPNSIPSFPSASWTWC